MPPSRFLPVTLILCCGLLGGYTAVFPSIRDGFLDALRACTSSGHCILQAPSHVPAYTSVPAIDSRLAVVLEFFAQGLTTDGRHLDLEALLAVSYLAAQFGGAWCLIALEGLRRGNAGTIMSWTGSFGIVFQVMTITIIAPIYLTIQLLLGPQQTADTIAVNALDLELLPISTGLAYILPTIGLTLPLLNILSPAGKYLAIALWQPFPLYQTAVHSTLRYIFRRTGAKGGSQRALNRVYSFVLFLTMGAHLLVVGAIAVSAWTTFLPQLSPTTILSPGSPTSPPTLSLLSPPVSPVTARNVVVSFLRWDVYCASTALVVWACHLSHVAREGASRVATFFRVVFWMAVGGPVTPAVMLLWERDVLVLANARNAKNK